jgi:hypothetical protein
MKHGLYLISEAGVTDFENEWLDGRTFDLVTTSYTSGEHDPEYITWEPSVYGKAKRDSLRRFFGEPSLPVHLSRYTRWGVAADVRRWSRRYGGSGGSPVLRGPTRTERPRSGGGRMTVSFFVRFLMP